MSLAHPAISDWSIVVRSLKARSFSTIVTVITVTVGAVRSGKTSTGKPGITSAPATVGTVKRWALIQ